ncbi:potassium calcium-activated channel subfamily U member 1 [Phyllostomus discolor]|uniref:Potassium channel subfamily U member 1 n=4 Tax=Phyllostomus discolor TaxID=89673 RepID=A0A834DI03_9CHIR|nr:potassium calcium-activated channel subfamily U member 1 [Phyllostomus discolor]
MFQSKLQNANEQELGKISCTTEIQAAFIISSVGTFLSGLLILFLFRQIWRAIRKLHNIKGTGLLLKLILSKVIGSKHQKSLQLHGEFRDHIEMLLSAQTFVGRVLGILVFALSIGSLIIYFINSSDPVGSCSSYQDKTIPIDLTFNAFFAFYFGLRFLAADDKIKFWLEMNSIVDIFTIPPTFISYYLKSNWLGLRFLRALRLLELPQILQILRAIRTSNAVKFSKLLAIILSTWFTAAGIIHLVENSGDPWLKGRNSQNISYFDSIYLVMATTSTVGFGDVVAKTSLGRTFIIFFTLGSLIIFANYIPEMVELFGNKKKYTTSYDVLKGKKFIVVCGNITVDSVTAFLRNFLRHKSGEIKTEIVFLGEAPPSLELESILKCSMSYTTFVSGSALKWEDLRRVAVESAEACLIIANPLCSDSHAEDTSNIMRVLSIKNYSPHTRVIIQILQSHNKDFLPKIPSWDWAAGDNIICFAELKLGLMAQGCLVPGLCTFLTSLFLEQNTKVSPKQPWQKIFVNGLKNKILTQYLSDDFAGMTFPEVSRLCFVKLHLMLIAIQYESMCSSSCGPVLNPPEQVKLHKNTLGFFIAESAKTVKRAAFYCATCHSDVHCPELIGKCSCKSRSHRSSTGTTMVVNTSNVKEPHRMALRDSCPLQQPSATSNISCITRTFRYEDSDSLDSTGMFHWCKATHLEKVILRRTDKTKHEFRNHIVACIFGDAHSTLMGLRNFVMPLRASNYTQQELKDIVFIGALDYLQREWRFLRNFPQIYILPGSALFAGDLHAVNIEECAMCAVLASPSTSSGSQTLVDTETIMATLNIGSLQISSCVQSPSEAELLLQSFEGTGEVEYRRVPILTELKNPSNIHFIEQIGRMEGRLPGTSLHLSTSFSTGSVFSGSFLDSLLASAFYNYHVLELLQMLVRGGISSQMEQQLDKDKFYGLTDSCKTHFSGRRRCKLGLLALNQTMLLDIEPKKTFGQVFCGLLDDFGILCFGLYRLIDNEKQNQEQKRFVITRPPNEFKLLPSDLVYCAIPSNIPCNRNDTFYQGSFEFINLAPQISVTSEASRGKNNPPTADPVDQMTTQPLNTAIHFLDPESIPVSDSKQVILTQSGKLSPQTHPDKTVQENENMKEPTVCSN